MSSFAIGPVNLNQSLSLEDPENTYYISGNLNAYNQWITIVAKNIIIEPNVTIRGARLNITCVNGVFITLGTIDAPRLRINATQVYFGGQKTARTNNVTIEAEEQDIHFGNDAALAAIGRIAQQFAIHRFQPITP